MSYITVGQHLQGVLAINLFLLFTWVNKKNQEKENQVNFQFILRKRHQQMLCDLRCLSKRQ